MARMRWEWSVIGSSAARHGWHRGVIHGRRSHRSWPLPLPAHSGESVVVPRAWKGGSSACRGSWRQG